MVVLCSNVKVLLLRLASALNEAEHLAVGGRQRVHQALLVHRRLRLGLNAVPTADNILKMRIHIIAVGIFFSDLASHSLGKLLLLHHNLLDLLWKLWNSGVSFIINASSRFGLG